MFIINWRHQPACLQVIPIWATQSLVLLQAHNRSVYICTACMTHKLYAGLHGGLMIYMICFSFIVIYGSCMHASM